MNTNSSKKNKKKANEVPKAKPAKTVPVKKGKHGVNFCINTIFAVLIIFSLACAWAPEVHSLRIGITDETVTDWYGTTSKAQVYSAQYKLSNGSKKKSTSNSVSYPQTIITIPHDLSSITELVPSADTSNAYFDVQASGRTIERIDTEQSDSMRISFPDSSYFVGKTVPDMLDYYQQQGYLVVFSLSNAGAETMSDEMKTIMSSMGFSTTPADVTNGSGWIGVWQNGEVLGEINGGDILKTSDDASIDNSTVQATGAAPVISCDIPVSGHDLYVVSKGSGSGDAVIKFDDIDYSGNHENDGLDIFVYDTANSKLIDSVEYSADAMATMNRNTQYFRMLKMPVYTNSLLSHVTAVYKAHDLFRRYVFSIAAALLVLIWLNIRKLIVIAKGKSETAVPGEAVVGANEAAPARKKSSFSFSFLIGQIGTIAVPLIAVLVVLLWNYLYAGFKDVEFAQLNYHLHADNTGTDWASFAPLFIKLLLFCAIALAISVPIVVATARVRSGHSRFITTRKRRTGLFLSEFALKVISNVLIFCSLAAFFANYNIFDYNVQRYQTSTIYEDYYADASTTNITFPEKKKNLIYIYLESYEISTASTDVGGGKSFNAEPELSDIALNEGDCFNGNGSGDTGKLNGGLMLGSTSWTIAGMIAQTAGIPLNIPTGGNKTDAENLVAMPGVTSLGDVLEDNNYHNVLYIGSDAEFANRKTYFKDHGDYDIDDYYRAQDQGLIPDDYYVWWGYEDAKLFEFAKDEVTYLADEAAKQASSDDADAGKPFNLTLLTTDTHFSNGYVCPDCVTDLPDQYSNVIRCSSKRVSEFIDWCKTQDWYDDTVIVLSGDHLYMDSSYYSDMPTGYQRKTYVSILNSSKEEPENERSFCTLDLFPTTLSAMGCTIDGDRLGLGTDAYSDTQTLTEELGQDQFDYQLGLRSDYYNEKLIETN